MVKDAEVTIVEVSTRAQIQSGKDSAQRILVVDDNTYRRKVCVDVLVDSGYEVEGVADGAAGWEAIQSKDYDLIITDNKMPKMTGLEMLEKMRASRLLVPV